MSSWSCVYTFIQFTFTTKKKCTYWRRITEEDMPEIIRFLQHFPTVISIDFCYNDVGDKGIEMLVNDFLNQENQLQHLNLMHCDLTGQSIQFLNNSEFLNLKSLRLNGNHLCPQTAGAIAKLIEKCPEFEYLDIAETDQTFESVATICHFVEYSNLKILDVSRVLPKSIIYFNNPTILANDMGYLLDRNSSLRELHLQKCDFLGHDMELLLYGLKTNKTLIMLDVGCNRIGNYGVEVLAKWLKTKPVLRALNISSNQIGVIGARALSLTLPYTSLRLLDISYNKINDIGMNHILYSLKKAEKMRLFYIWGNPFSVKACLIIDRMIKTGVLVQEHTDVKVYYVDGVALAAYYPANHYKHKYYCVMDHGCPIEIKIKKNKIPDQYAQPRALLDLKNYDRFPPVRFDLGSKPPREDYCDSKCLD